MSGHRLALSTLLLAICGLALAVDSPSRVTGYRYTDIFTIQLGGSERRNLTRNYVLSDDSPALSPDGRTLVFERGRIEGGYLRSGLVLMPSRGGRGRQLVRIPGGDAWKPTWSRDGKYIAFSSSGRIGIVRRDRRGLTWIPDTSDPT